ncbi:MAG TPA: hypothetical protein DCZ94_15795 [Lentisphaeria bacterium]|nr:MAG: hypothetical protein A2X48_18640 [Lentisphaerae bacterium GWF2_49_21]HBC88412.1 hypothetical protein [Lentisphaeria bacterium]
MHKKLLLLSISVAVAAGIALSTEAAALLDGPLTNGDERFLLQNDAVAVAGGVEVDTTKDNVEWHEFIVSVPANLVLEAGKSYKISYDYVIKNVKDGKTKFYHLLRTGGDAKKDKGLEFWSDAAGAKGHKEFTALLKDADYRLILGVQFGGAIRIEKLRIEVVENGK